MKIKEGIFALALLATTSSFALEKDPSVPAQTPLPVIDIDTAPVDKAVVKLDGRPMLQVRGIAGYPAEQRVKAIQSRIEGVARDPMISTSSLKIVHLADRSNVVADQTLLVSIFDADAQLERLPRELLANRTIENIATAILEYRHDRSRPVLVRRTGLSVIATLILLLVLRLVGWIFRKLVYWAEHSVKQRVESLETRSSSAIESRPLWTAIMGILNAMRLIVIAMVLYFYLNLILGLYPWTRPIAARLFSIFIDPLEALAMKFIHAIPDMAFLVVLAFVVQYVMKVTRLFFGGIASGNITFKDFEQDWAWPTYRIVRLLIICFALVVAYPYIPGSESDAFKGVSLFVGVLFSLGSTSFISNIIASIALTYRRAFKVGDMIRVDNVTGVVTDMRLQATHIRTFYNEVVVIPNSVIVNTNVTNLHTLSKDKGLVLHTQVGIGYETPWRQVEAMLVMAAERTPGLRADQKPRVLQRSLGDFSITYELLVWCEAPLSMPLVYNALHQNILDVFNEYGVQIMTPAYEGDPETPKIVPKDRVHAAPGDKISG